MIDKADNRTTADWSEYGGSAHRMNRTSETLSPPLVLKWRAKTDGFLFDSPLVCGDRVLAGSRDCTYRCWSLADGAELWKHVLDPAGEQKEYTFMENYPLEDGAVVAGPNVLVGSMCGYAQALSLATGERIWHRRIGGPISSAPPLVTAAGVLWGVRAIGDRKSYSLLCLSSQDGVTQWESPIPDRCVGLAAEDDIVIAVQSRKGGRVTAFRTSTGQALWERQFEGDLAAGVLIHNGIVFVGMRAEAVVGLSLADGSEQWRVGVPAVYAPLSTDGKCLYVPGGQLRAYDLATQHLLWSSTETRGGYINAAATVAGDFLYIGGGHARRIDCLDRTTGQLAWSFQTGDMVFSTPVVSRGCLLVGSHDGYLYCFHSSAESKYE